MDYVASGIDVADVTPREIWILVLPGQDWGLQDPLVGPPDLSDIREKRSQPIDKRVDILACLNHIHELTVRDSKLSNYQGPGLPKVLTE